MSIHTPSQVLRRSVRIGTVALVLVIAVALGGTLLLRSPTVAPAALVRSWQAPTVPTVPEPVRWVNPSSVGRPYGDTVAGLLTFRGNPTRTYYGAGPMPTMPKVLWSFPETAMCAQSRDGGENKTWCGTGWTGQPAVFERDGRTWVVFGAYDRKVHFLDAATGAPLRQDFPTGDIIKGSVTIDPDGFPLVYTGSRDNSYRVIAFDRDPPAELWALGAHDVGPTMWNDDWDGSGIVLNDHLFIGGENSRIHVVRLGRGYGADGLATVSPELVFHAAGWDDELLGALGDSMVSIENSVAISGDMMYFANSGGLVQGWNIGALRDGGEPQRTFRFWMGDDTDASVVIDEAGMLYVAAELERRNARSSEVGQIVKLDPSRPDPLVWSIAATATGHKGAGGVWATPALHRDVVYAATNSGKLLALDRSSGAQRWALELPGPTWQSPVVVDDVLLQGDCSGVLHAYDVRNTAVLPPELWQVTLGGCIESTPAVWKGRIYVGTRSGRFYAIGDK